ncbi:MAG: fimbrial protein [Dyella sp.]
MAAPLPPADRSGAHPELVLYATDAALARTLIAKLQAIAEVHWVDSAHLPPTQLARRGSALRVILLDYSARQSDHSSALARELTELLPSTPLVAIGSMTPEHAAGVLAAWRSGVKEFIDVDASADEIVAALRKAQQSATVLKPAPPPASRRNGRLILLLGVRPGVGTSTLASHLGALAQADGVGANKPSDTAFRGLLIDLGRPAGDASLYLGLAGDFHYHDALRNAARIDATLARTALAHHASELALLGQPADTWDAPPGGSDTNLLIERLRGVYDLLLCDLGGLTCRQIPTPLLSLADEIWLIADQGIACVISLDSYLRELDALGARDGRVSLVINRFDEASGLAPAQLAQRFSLPLLATLPDRGRALRSSANQGKLLHEINPRDSYLRGLAPLIQRLKKGAGPDAQTVVSPFKQRLHSLGGRLWQKKT